MVSYSSTVILTKFSVLAGESSGPKRLLSGKQQTFLHFLGLGINLSPHTAAKAAGASSCRFGLLL
jgi:hypothetical protein